jgi:hypothetical protein
MEESIQEVNEPRGSRNFTALSEDVFPTNGALAALTMSMFLFLEIQVM